MEHSAGLADELVRRDGCLDALALREAAILDQLPSDAGHRDRCEWDALAGARLDAVADELPPDLPDADAGKSADPERDVQARDG